MHISLCITHTQYSTKNSSDNLPSYVVYNRHCSNVYLWRRDPITCIVLIELMSFTFHSTQNRSFWNRSSQPISWFSTEEIKSNATKANKQEQSGQKHTKNKPKPNPTVNCKNWSCLCSSLCNTVVHNTAQES